MIHIDIQIHFTFQNANTLGCTFYLLLNTGTRFGWGNRLESWAYNAKEETKEKTALSLFESHEILFPR